MSEKIQALSQPIAWDVEYATASSIDGECVYTLRTSRPLNPGEALYSQESMTALLDENEYLRMRFKESDLTFGRALLAMRAAVIETAHGGGLAAGMEWIVNFLEGPGEFAPKDEVDAQAYYDRESEKIDLELIKCLEYFTARNEAKKLVASKTAGDKS